jgi:hypothetical protein
MKIAIKTIWVFMAMLCISISASAEYITLDSCDFEVDGLWYSIKSNNTCSVAYYKSDILSGDVIIPETIIYNNSTYSITSIGSGAFFDCSGMTSVTIPSTITSIGSYAFYGCSNLTSVSIPNAVTKIDGGAFAFCNKLGRVDITDLEAWCNIENSGAFSTEYWLFLNGIKITNLEIPKSITKIGDYVFSYCSGLTSVSIPSTITEIGKGAFNNCSSLTSIEIPNSVTEIGAYAFGCCWGLTSIELPDSIATISDGLLQYCNNLTTVTIPKSVTSIGEYAFFGCSDCA